MAGEPSDEELERWADERISARKQRRENPYVRSLIQILLGHATGVHRSIVIAEMRALRQARGLAIPKRFEQAVQSALQQHSSESARFNGNPGDDLFYWPHGRGRGKHSGIWAVHPERAREWLRARDIPD